MIIKIHLERRNKDGSKSIYDLESKEMDLTIEDAELLFPIERIINEHTNYRYYLSIDIGKKNDS